jgi:type I restriction enzyme S subunit
MKWRSCTVGNFVENGLAEIQTGPFGTQLHASDYVEEGIPVINVRNIGFGTLKLEKLEFVGEEIAERLSPHLLKKEDIVFGRKGAVDRHLLVTEEQENWMQGSDCIRLRFNTVEVYPRFVSYALLLPHHREWMITNASNKATMASLNHDIIERIPFRLPPPQIQQRIIDILSPYDDLIENNLRRMALLEESARLLYREWFVRLRFPGHEHTRIVNGVPEGWERKQLGDVLTLNYGKALKESDRIEGPVPVYGSSGVVGTHSEALVKGPGIIVGRKGNVGSIYWAESDFWPIDTVYFVESHQSNYFLFHNLQHQNFLNSDGAVPGLNRNYAYSLPVLLPKQMIREEFEQTVTPIYEQTLKLRTMNQKLKTARDLLLPRLMSGEIAV